MERITWTEKEKYGLDYSTKLGTFQDYIFDIRYDYCGDLTVKPKCGLWLSIYKNGVRVHQEHSGSMQRLTEFSENYLENEAKKFLI